MALQSLRDQNNSVSNKNNENKTDEKASSKIKRPKQESTKKSKPFKNNKNYVKSKRKYQTTDAVVYEAVEELIAYSPIVGPQIPPIATYYPHYTHSYPVTISEWNPIIPIQNALLNVQPMPIVINPVQLQTAPLCPYVCPVMPPIVPPVVTTILPELINYDQIINYGPKSDLVLEEIIEPQYTEESVIAAQDERVDVDPIEFYLKLPRDLFPNARMLALDPNPIIDEFCKIANLGMHVPWLLDLEFGIPKTPITRLIPTYSVKFNSIHCKNEPDAIHPGFESCNQDFKRVLIFNYDCIISAWYSGYILMMGDSSVENFQSWLLVPMELLGMCWP